MPTYTSLDTFRPDINQYVPGAPAILLRRTVLRSAILFCERTLILKRNPSEFELCDEESLYTLKYSSDRYRAVAIDEARLGEGSGSKRLSVTTENEMDHSMPNWREHTGPGDQPSMCWLTEDTNEVRIYPTPNSDSTDDLYLTTRVVYMRDQTEVDLFLYEKWEEIIQAGALAELFAIPNSTWFDMDMSRTFAQIWKRGIRRARKTVLTGTGKYPGRVLPQNYVIQGDGGMNGRRTTTWV